MRILSVHLHPVSESSISHQQYALAWRSRMSWETAWLWLWHTLHQSAARSSSYRWICNAWISAKNPWKKASVTWSSLLPPGGHRTSQLLSYHCCHVWAKHMMVTLQNQHQNTICKTYTGTFRGPIHFFATKSAPNMSLYYRCEGIPQTLPEQ